MSNEFWVKSKVFWEKNDQKILTGLLIFLVSLASYRAGQTAERSRQATEIKIDLVQPAAEKKEQNENKQAEIVGNLLGEKLTEGQLSSKKESDVSGEKKDCAFVGSKNSNKYHLPTCRYAANIKEENKRCFASSEEAEKAGYVAASCCLKK